MKKIRLGFIGAGFISQIAHLPCFYNDSRIKIEAISDLNKNLLIKVSKKYQVEKIYTNHIEMIKKEKLDAIILAVQRSNTEKIAKDIMQKKISLFSEKPAALSFKVAKKLSKLSERMGVKYIIGYMKQHDNGIIFLKKNLNKIRLGKLKSIYYESFLGDSYSNPFEYFKHDDKNYRRKNTLNKKIVNKKLIFIKFLNTHCHSINLMRYLFGELNFDYKSLSNQGEGLVFFKTKNKIKVVLNNQYSKAKRWIENILINYEDGKIIIKMPTPLLKNSSAEILIENYKTGKITKPWINWGWSFRNQANFFVNLLKSKKKIDYFCSAKNCLKDLYLIEQIFKK